MPYKDPEDAQRLRALSDINPDCRGIIFLNLFVRRFSTRIINFKDFEPIFLKIFS